MFSFTSSSSLLLLIIVLSPWQQHCCYFCIATTTSIFSSTKLRRRKRILSSSTSSVGGEVATSNGKALALAMSNQHVNNNNDPNIGLTNIPQLVSSSTLKNKIIKQEEEQQQRNDNKNDNNSLTAFIHIGPQKTASSIIQRMMLRVLDELRMDGIMKVPDVNYAGSHSFSQCFKPYDIQQNTRKTIEQNQQSQNQNHRKLKMDIDYTCYQETLDKTHEISTKYNMNLIASAETFASPLVNTTHLKEYLSPYWSKVQIIASYRRFYSWLASYHNQHYKGRLPLYGEEIVDWLNIDRINKVYDNFYITGNIRRYKQDFDTIKIINMHHLPYPDMMETFFCDAIGNNETNACQKYRSIVSDEGQMQGNKEHILVYQEIAYYAQQIRQQHSLPNNNNIDFVKQAQYYQEVILKKTRYEFELSLIECPSQEILDRLLQMSLETEKELLPEYYAKQGEEEIRKEFAIYSKQKLCTIRGKNVMQQKDWIDYFLSL